MKDRLLSRSVMVFRASPEDVESLLPDGVRPQVLRGFAPLALCYSRFASGPARWLPLPHEPTFHRLHLGVAVGSEGARYVFEESTSSWVRAHLGKHASPCSRSAFALTDRQEGGEHGEFELTVRHRGREVLYLRAEPRAELADSLFRSSREAADLLGANAPDCVLEPLEVFELRAAWIDALPIDAELDSAFRSTRVRPSRAAAPADAREIAQEYGSAAPPVPYLPGY